MPITRNSSQGRSLEEFYQEAACFEAQEYGAPDKMPGGAHSMLRLLVRINAIFRVTQLWGLTSHYHLILQNDDNWQAANLISIVAGMDGTFYIDYLMPSALQPWPDATVRGEANSLAEAERYLLIAMRECQGWEGNAELADLLKQNGLEY